jgi:hypothetical protein
MLCFVGASCEILKNRNLEMRQKGIDLNAKLEIISSCEVGSSSEAKMINFFDIKRKYDMY